MGGGLNCFVESTAAGESLPDAHKGALTCRRQALTRM